jgi:hypothetical protein
MLVGLAGCRLDADVEVTVDGDGGGALAVTMATDRELQRRAGQAATDPLDALAEAVEAADGWTVAREPSDGGRAVTAATTFSDPAALRRVTADFAEGLAAAELTPLVPMDVALTDDTVALSGSAGLRVRPAVAELGLSETGARRLLADAVSLRVVARMPGEVVTSNADRTPAADTVIWDVPAGERVDFAVRSERPWTVGRVLDALVGPYGLAAVITVALVVAVVVVIRRRQAPARSARMRSRSERT